VEIEKNLPSSNNNQPPPTLRQTSILKTHHLPTNTKPIRRKLMDKSIEMLWEALNKSERLLKRDNSRSTFLQHGVDAE
jgi:hypothetical protein